MTAHARRFTTAGAVALGALLLAGCSGIGSSSSDAERPMGGTPAPMSQEYGEAAGSDASASSAPADRDEAGSGADGAGSSAERMVISTGWVQVAVTDPVEAADDVVALVEDAGGRIDSRSIVAAAEGRHPFASLVVRIPSEDLTVTLDALDDVGETVRSEIAAEDVTGTVQDLDARIRATELSVERLEALLASAESNVELIEAESALTTRQSELEQLQTQRTRLGDQVALSTITVELTVPSEVPVVRSAGFSGGLADGWGSLVSFFTGALVVVGVLLPWAVLLGLLAAVFLVVRRLRAQRRGAVAGGAAVAGGGAADAGSGAADASAGPATSAGPAAPAPSAASATPAAAEEPSTENTPEQEDPAPPSP